MAEDDIYVKPVKIDSCPFCKSSTIVRHVKIDQTADADRIGLSYKTRFIFRKIEPFYADVCDHCGSIIRLFVDKPQKEWVVK